MPPLHLPRVTQEVQWSANRATSGSSLELLVLVLAVLGPICQESTPECPATSPGSNHTSGLISQALSSSPPVGWIQAAVTCVLVCTLFQQVHGQQHPVLPPYLPVSIHEQFFQSFLFSYFLCNFAAFLHFFLRACVWQSSCEQPCGGNQGRCTCRYMALDGSYSQKWPLRMWRNPHCLQVRPYFCSMLLYVCIYQQYMLLNFLFLVFFSVRQ